MKMIAGISTTCKKENDIKWNFTKFLVDRSGRIVKRWGPTDVPSDFARDIEELL